MKSTIILLLVAATNAVTLTQLPCNAATIEAACDSGVCPPPKYCLNCPAPSGNGYGRISSTSKEQTQ